MTLQDWSTYILFIISASFGVEAMRDPRKGRLFWVCALVCLLCLAAVLVLEAAQPSGM